MVWNIYTRNNTTPMYLIFLVRILKHTMYFLYDQHTKLIQKHTRHPPLPFVKLYIVTFSQSNEFIHLSRPIFCYTASQQPKSYHAFLSFCFLGMYSISMDLGVALVGDEDSLTEGDFNAIDFKVLKCWRQSGRTWLGIETRFMRHITKAAWNKCLMNDRTMRLTVTS